MVHARTSTGPQVKYRMSCESQSGLTQGSTYVKGCVTGSRDLSERAGGGNRLELLLAGGVVGQGRKALLERNRKGDE